MFFVFYWCFKTHCLWRFPCGFPPLLQETKFFMEFLIVLCRLLLDTFDTKQRREMSTINCIRFLGRALGCDEALWWRTRTRGPFAAALLQHNPTQGCHVRMLKCWHTFCGSKMWSLSCFHVQEKPTYKVSTVIILMIWLTYLSRTLLFSNLQLYLRSYDNLFSWRNDLW